MWSLRIYATFSMSKWLINPRRTMCPISANSFVPYPGGSCTRKQCRVLRTVIPLIYSSRMRDTISTATTVEPASYVRGTICVPGDKSISHRYAILAALADGRSTIRNYAPGADCASTLRCLDKLAVSVGGPGSEGLVTVDGMGLGGLQPPEQPLDAGNSGTTMRLLAGVLAGHNMITTITGDDSLRRRPMHRVVEPLERMGATVRTDDGRPPLVITGGRLSSVHYEPPVASAQVKSAVLLAGLHASGETWVRERFPTRDHTERALGAFGVPLRHETDRVGVCGGDRLHGTDVVVPGDFSSAVFWFVAAAVLQGSSIEVTDVGLNPSRTRVLEILHDAGAKVEVSLDTSTDTRTEPVGTVRITSSNLRPLEISPRDVPSLIDELPALAVLGVYGGGLVVRGAVDLRAKESDRIAVLVAGLRQMGARVDEYPDGFRIHDSTRPSGGTVDAGGDHRMVMAFAIAALGGTGPTTIMDHEVVSVSYPRFFDNLTTLRH